MGSSELVRQEYKIEKENVISVQISRTSAPVIDVEII